MNKESVNVLETTEYVVKHAKSVYLHEDKVETLIPKVKTRLEKGVEDSVMGLGEQKSFDDEVQLIFVEDTVNFCFWAEKGKEKWQIEFPKGNIIKGGAYGMMGSFKRALVEGVPILDANYLANITQEQVENLFRSTNGVEIPLLKKRLENLREAGSVLLEKYSGKFSNALIEAGYNAIRLVNLLHQNFPSFADIAKYEDRDVYF